MSDGAGYSARLLARSPIVFISAYLLLAPSWLVLVVVEGNGWAGSGILAFPVPELLAAGAATMIAALVSSTTRPLRVRVSAAALAPVASCVVLAMPVLEARLTEVGLLFMAYLAVGTASFLIAPFVLAGATVLAARVAARDEHSSGAVVVGLGVTAVVISVGWYPFSVVLGAVTGTESVWHSSAALAALVCASAAVFAAYLAERVTAKR